MEFVRIREKYGRKNEFEHIYDGVIISKSKQEIEVFCVGPDKKDIIMRKTFDLKEIKIVKQEKSTVEHYFKLGILTAENALNDAEFALMDAKHVASESIAKFKKCFGKDPDFN